MTKEVFPCLLLVKVKEMMELVLESTKEVGCYLKPHVRSQLLKEFAFMHYLSVLVQHLICDVKSHCVVKAVRHSFSLQIFV